MVLALLCTLFVDLKATVAGDITRLLPIGEGTSIDIANTDLLNKGRSYRTFDITYSHTTIPCPTITARLMCTTPPALYGESGEPFTNDSRITLYYRDLVFFTSGITHDVGDLVTFEKWLSTLLEKASQRQIMLDQSSAGTGSDFWQYILVENNVLIVSKPEMTALCMSLTPSHGWQIIIKLLRGMPYQAIDYMLHSWTQIIIRKHQKIRSAGSLVPAIPGSSPISSSPVFASLSFSSPDSVSLALGSPDDFVAALTASPSNPVDLDASGSLTQDDYPDTM